MGNIDISIDDDFLKLARQFENHLSHRQIVNGVRRAMNRALVSMRHESLKEIRKQIRITERDLRTKYIKLRQVRGATLIGLEGWVAYSKTPIPLLEFVRGGKQPIEQKGLRVSQRRKLRVEITPGNRVVLAHAFIQRARTLQVFKGRRNVGFHKQGIVSVGHRVRPGPVGEVIERHGLTQFQAMAADELQRRAKGFVKGMGA